ncbi:hypothetical protein [Nitrosopumilus sp.]|uniref:hypothetical protein n=1 Tax=Nitrosopumilus sp. TaxID=2024843 RepID=UPI00292F2E8E|nr:hypothetical protein [Nitrosopumilus sp.]
MSTKIKKKKSATKDLLYDDNVRRWYDNTSRGSKLNVDIRLRRLNLFCYRTNTTPSSLVKIGKREVIKLENILLDHVSWLESQNYAPNYIDGILKSIRSWLVFNYIEPKRKIIIANAGIPVNIQDEQVPTKEQLQSILNVANPRTRTSISLMAFSGIRPQVMGNADATDGLKLADLDDLVIANEGKTVSFSQIPAMVTVRASLSKTKNKYFTFLPAEGCEYVLGYLRKRISAGERLASDSPVISLEQGYQSRRKIKHKSEKQSSTGLITTPRITSDIRKVIWSITKVRPYVLRAYFDTQLLLAESHGKMTHAYRQFFMGHKGDIEARYTTNKGRLTDEMISDMRRAYSKSQQFLCTINNENNNSSQSKKEMLLDMWREQAKLYGIDPVKIKIEKQRKRKEDNNDLTNTDDKKISDIEQETDAIRQEIMKIISASASTSTKEISQQKQYDGKIIKNDEQLLHYICQGWEPIKELTQNRVILRRQKLNN